MENVLSPSLHDPRPADTEQTREGDPFCVYEYLFLLGFPDPYIILSEGFNKRWGQSGEKKQHLQTAMCQAFL